MYPDIFFITEKTNLLLKATGWEMLTISMKFDPVCLVATIQARLNGEVIGTTQIKEYLFSCESDKQKKLVAKLHEFAVVSYDHYINAKRLD